MRALAFDLELQGSVRFLGAVSDVATVLSASDLAIHSSFAEGISNSVLEEMAAGLMVVGTDIPGVREALGPDARLVTVGDHQELSRRILEAFDSPQLRELEGRRNCDRARTEFGMDQMKEAWANLLAAIDERDERRT
jgi:glycosyltransferase involved in cell wall biosynthesis